MPNESGEVADMYAGYDEGALEEISLRYVDSMPENVRRALIERGWTPPKEQV
jgi:hypothetical protein